MKKLKLLETNYQSLTARKWCGWGLKRGPSDRKAHYSTPPPHEVPLGWEMFVTAGGAAAGL